MLHNCTVSVSLVEDICSTDKIMIPWSELHMHRHTLVWFSGHLSRWTDSYVNNRTPLSATVIIITIPPTNTLHQLFYTTDAELSHRTSSLAYTLQMPLATPKWLCIARYDAENCPADGLLNHPRRCLTMPNIVSMWSWDNLYISMN